MTEINLGSLYELNKQAVAKLNPLSILDLNIKIAEVAEDLYLKSLQGKSYWMLLCNDRKDYTVFIVFSKEGMIEELRPTLQNRGQIISIDKQPDENYEIWIRDSETAENFVYYLFDYSNGVIEA